MENGALLLYMLGFFGIMEEENTSDSDSEKINSEHVILSRLSSIPNFTFTVNV